MTLSPQQIQQLSIPTQTLAPPPAPTQAVQLKIPTQITQTTLTPAIKQESETQTVQIKEADVSNEQEEIFNDSYDDIYGGDEEESFDEGAHEEEKTSPDKKVAKNKSIKVIKAKTKSSESFEEPLINPEQSELAKKQIEQILNHNAKRTDESDVNGAFNLTVCDVSECIERKEFAMNSFLFDLDM